MSFRRNRSRDLGYVSPNSRDFYQFSFMGSNPMVYKWPTVGFSLGSDTCGDQTNPGPPYRSGGAFCVNHTSVTWGGSSFHATSYNTQGTKLYDYEGVFQPPYGQIISNESPSGFGTTWGDPTNYGPTGWNRFKPTRSKCDLSVFLGELRDIPGMIKRTWELRRGVKRFKDLGSHYLNHEFGWMPFVRDLYSFFETANKVGRYYDNFRRNNGQKVRRSGNVASGSNSTCVDVGPGCLPALNSAFYDVGYVQPNGKKWVTDSYRFWFEAAFRYWIPDLPEKPGLPQFARMFGLTVSPSVIWELTPWSWLVDWFASIGDNLANVTDSLDNLVAEYAYVMGHNVHSVRYEYNVDYYSHVVGTQKQSPSHGTCYIQKFWETKWRLPASPYGFGLSWPDFSARQLAILAALGITRMT